MDPLTEQPETELLAMMEVYEGEPEGDAALREVLRRHKRYIFGIIEKRIADISFLNSESIFWAVLERIFEKSGSFSSEATDDEIVRKQFRGWVGQIAQNVVREAFRDEFPSEQSLDEIPEPVTTVIADSKMIAAVESIIEEKLNDCEKDILSAWTLVQKLHGGQGRMTDEDINALCKKYDTKPVNIRQIRRRAVDKIKPDLEQLINEKGTKS